MSEPCIWQRWPRWKLTENYPAKNCYITCQSWHMHRIWWKKNRRKKWTWPTWVTSQESFAPGENLLSPLPLPQHYGHTSSILRDSYWSAERGSCQTSYGWWIKMTFSFFILLPIDGWIATLETTFDVGRWKHGPSVCFCVVTELSHSCDYSVLDSITDTNRCGR